MSSFEGNGDRWRFSILRPVCPITVRPCTFPTCHCGGWAQEMATSWISARQCAQFSEPFSQERDGRPQQHLENGLQAISYPGSHSKKLNKVDVSWSFSSEDLRSKCKHGSRIWKWWQLRPGWLEHLELPNSIHQQRRAQALLRAVVTAAIWRNITAKPPCVANGLKKFKGSIEIDWECLQLDYFSALSFLGFRVLWLES